MAAQRKYPAELRESALRLWRESEPRLDLLRLAGTPAAAAAPGAAGRGAAGEDQGDPRHQRVRRYLRVTAGLAGATETAAYK